VSTDCPNENQILALLQGRLSAQQRWVTEHHVDSCPDCSLLLSELGKLHQSASDQLDGPLHHPPIASSPIGSVAPAPLGAVASSPPGSASTSPYRDAMPLQGERIDRYVIESVLGWGGMGIVCVALDPMLQRRVALKLIRRELVSEAEQIDEAHERLLREARVMATLTHPNVAAVYDAGRCGVRVFITMELVQGQTLADWLRADSHRWSSVLERFLDAGMGLQAAHEAGVMHRDFKPDNVLIGQDGRVRVCDFGLARAHRPDGDAAAGAPSPGMPSQGAAQLTVEGAIVGTPAYMAPEQRFGHSVDPRADQFSFCVALYEALFGERPYRAGSAEAMQAMLMADGQLAGPQDKKGVPAGVIRALRRGLQVNPAQRFASMSELLAALRSEAKAPAELHLRVHTICQSFFCVAHIAAASWFTYDTYFIRSDADFAPRNTSPPAADGGFDLFMVLFLIWVLVAICFLYGGALWAALNTIALLKRKRWGRYFTIGYSLMAMAVCIGIPYAIYTLWSLTRPTVVASFSD